MTEKPSVLQTEIKDINQAINTFLECLSLREKYNVFGPEETAFCMDIDPKTGKQYLNPKTMDYIRERQALEFLASCQECGGIYILYKQDLDLPDLKIDWDNLLHFSSNAVGQKFNRIINAFIRLRVRKERELKLVELKAGGKDAKTPPQAGPGETTETLAPQTTAPREKEKDKGIKKFFRNHWQWLIGAIIGFLGMIFGILQFLVK